MIDQATRAEIDKITSGILKDAGMKDPPFLIDRLIAHLQLHHGFYDLEDPSFLQRLRHKIVVGGLKIASITEKIRLCGIWLPDMRKILVNSSLPGAKIDWTSFHDASHAVLPWHKDFFMGDTAQTLDPDFQEMLESEANYGASAFMFGGQLFTKEALHYAPEWNSVQALKKRYKKSLTTTLRRFVQFSHDIPMAMVVNTAWWDPKPEGQEHRVRHFVGSGLFGTQFACVTRDWILTQINANTRRRKGGIVGEFGLMVADVDGVLHQFNAESFYNTHDVLTLLVCQQKRAKISPIFGASFLRKPFRV